MGYCHPTLAVKADGKTAKMAHVYDRSDDGHLTADSGNCDSQHCRPPPPPPPPPFQKHFCPQKYIWCPAPGGLGASVRWRSVLRRSWSASIMVTHRRSSRLVSWVQRLASAWLAMNCWKRGSQASPTASMAPLTPAMSFRCWVSLCTLSVACQTLISSLQTSCCGTTSRSSSDRVNACTSRPRVSQPLGVAAWASRSRDICSSPSLQVSASSSHPLGASWGGADGTGATGATDVDGSVEAG